MRWKANELLWLHKKVNEIKLKNQHNALECLVKHFQCSLICQIIKVWNAS